jgi:uridine phosphorylase
MGDFLNSEKQYHIDCKKGDVGRYVLLPGSPDRVPLIASFFDNPREIARKREYVTYTGSLDGVPVSVTSTGIGGPSTAIAVEELSKIGADTFIRVGTSGIMQKFMNEGDLIVATGAVRDEGTSHQYLPAAFPAVADIEVINALRTACVQQGRVFHTGVVHSKDSFFGEVESERMPLRRELQERWQAWIAGGALCSEMESATLFVVAAVLGKRAGALMQAGGTHHSVEAVCQTAVQALRELISLDSASHSQE